MEDYLDFELLENYEDDIHKETFYETWEYCNTPTLQEILPYIWKMIFCNIIFRLVITLKFIPIYMHHIFSMIIGTTLLFLIMPESSKYVLVFIIFCYIIYKIFYWTCTRIYIYIVTTFYFVYLIGSELFFPDPAMWMETRGIHMLIAMKFISFMFDAQKKSVTELPNVIEIGGYILCPNNCIVGPWVSYKSYSVMLEKNKSIIELSWILHLIVFVTISLACLLISNCWAPFIIPKAFKWTTAYQEALSFRSSHYFVSFLSSTLISITGLRFDQNKKVNDVQAYIVTKPYFIELPRSLVQVVVYWNMPMHMWLKKYVFRISKPLGNFTAVIFTYLVSSFLHGFNIKLAAVLLSLGFYTYVEYEFRKKLSIIFDACIKANPCIKCEHKYKTDKYVYLVNTVFTLLAIFHLAYLGCLVDNLIINSESNENIFEKWSELGYVSHIITGCIYVFHKII